MKSINPVFFSFFGIILLLLSEEIRSQGIKLNWGKSYASSYQGVVNVVFDDSSNFYVGGIFNDTINFDLNTAKTNIGVSGHAGINSPDFFLSKHDSTGNFIWGLNWGSRSHDILLDFDIDSKGNTILCGRFEDTVDFDPGPGVVMRAAQGIEDLFLMKISPLGKLIWVHTLTGSHGSDLRAVEVTDSDEIIALGSINGNPDFNKSAAVDTLGSSITPRTFIWKLDSAGNHLWVKSHKVQGSGNMSYGFQLQLDSNDQIYFCGQYLGVVDFNTGSQQTAKNSSGQRDAYVSKLDKSGNLIWVKSFGGVKTDIVTEIALDKNSDIVLTGYWNGTVDFDPGSGVQLLTTKTNNNNGQEEFFVLRLDSNGIFKWVNSIDAFYPHGLVVNQKGNIILTGGYRGLTDFDPGVSSHFESPVGLADSYILSLDSTGGFNWVKTFGDRSDNFSFNCTIDSEGRFLVTGSAIQIIDLDPGEDTVLSSTGTYVQFFDTCTIQNTWDTIVACDSYTWSNGVTYSNSNYSAKILDFDSVGCDSISHLWLTIYKSNFALDKQVACDSLKWIDGNVYSSDTYFTHKHLLKTKKGCDSLVYLDLKIINSSDSEDSVISCDTYKWIDQKTYTTSDTTAQHILRNSLGCDSIVTLNLEILNSSFDTINARSCFSYKSPSGLYSWASSGVYSDTLKNSVGCDSVLSVQLKIDTVNIGIYRSKDSLVSLAQNASYQWLKCDTTTLINNEISKNLIVPNNGRYAVIVTQGQCVDTSACIEVTNLYTTNLKATQKSAVYPNPTKGELIIEFNNPVKDISIKVYSYSGSLISKYEAIGKKSHVLSLPNPKGVYVIKIKGDKIHETHQVIKL